CEPRCPSRDLTLTPRQRIVITREMTRLRASDDPLDRAWAESLAADFEYEGLATCAGDSMCQTSCPVRIDTGALRKERKAARHPGWSLWLAKLAARRFRLLGALARGGLGMAAFVRSWPGGARLLELVTDPLHYAAPALVPRIHPDLDLP